jgi:uncharacterized membrane protein
MINLFVAMVVLYMIGAVLAHVDDRASRIVCLLGAIGCIVTGIMVFMRLD